MSKEPKEKKKMGRPRLGAQVGVKCHVSLEQEFVDAFKTMAAENGQRPTQLMRDVLMDWVREIRRAEAVATGTMDRFANLQKTLAKKKALRAELMNPEPPPFQDCQHGPRCDGDTPSCHFPERGE